MKLHNNLVRAVVDALFLIFTENKYADKVIEKVLQSNKRWGSHDRGFIAENTYEIVRWWRLLNFLARTENEELTHESLWKIFGVWQIINDESLPRWEEFADIQLNDVEKRYESAKKTRKLIQSVPDWMDELASKELGKQWDREIVALNREAQVVLRVNTLKTTRSELKALLAEESIETTVLENMADALVLKERTNVFTSPHFKNGLFEIQDASSQLVADFVEVEGNMRVIDACAGAGGKTLHLAALMQNKGKIIAMDTEEWKLTELKKRARRGGANNIETRLIDNNKAIKRLADSADRLLLDVPCSGLGVLKRNPDAKWKLDVDFINHIKETQQEILQNYVQMLRKGGQLVYATCSILPSESENQVEKFLESQNGAFELLDQQRISPAQTGFDGFYMARLLKK
ncbi:MAG: methyltransferase domain-containing protein [Verrucomicrobia bacterium]|nr:methyltransferase domain-containing protein [Cytophagales bacterium]